MSILGDMIPHGAQKAPQNSTGGDAAQQTLQELLAGVGPQLAAGQVQQAGLQQQLGALGAETGLSNAYSQAMAGIQEGQMGIGREQLGIRGQGLQAQMGLSAEQQAIEQQQFGLQMSQFPEQQAQLALQNKNATQQMQGSQAASGALNTEGSKSAQSTLASEQGWAQQDLARAQQQALLGQQSEVAGYQYQQGEFGRSQQNLALMAQANGLSEQQLVEQLNYGIAQNNLQGKTSAGQLLAQMGSLAAGDISTAGAAIAPIAYAGGVNPLVGVNQLP